MIRLKEAQHYAEMNGKSISRKDLAQLLWKNSKTSKSAYMNLLNLEREISKTIEIAQIPIICKECGVSADYLFGLTSVPNYNHGLEDRKKELLDQTTALFHAIQNI